MSPCLPHAPRLPVYRVSAGAADAALRPAIEAGAHGLAQVGTGPP